MPHFPQRFEPPDWPTGALCEGAGPEIWGDRACGLACLRMITSYFGLAVPSQYDLVRQAVDSGAYTSRGILHQGLADLAGRHGVSAAPVALDTAEEMRRLLTTCGPVVVSVTHQFPEDGRRGGHLVVVTGVHRTPEPAVTFRDPSRWGHTHSEVPVRRFFSSFTGRAIVFAAHPRTLRAALGGVPGPGPTRAAQGSPGTR
ncbi:C39 family peptidase [Streptomyces viridochromogenes]|uniref:C39 family peptidase n=1 Tax=Streptomyces viridochromogenes TaxID=1938 RepID=UPI00131D7A16|nr:papain-like cysteine protease family protein [Streptomyces viridochromogenes]